MIREVPPGRRNQSVATKLAEKLPRREREIMDVLYALGSDASVEDIRSRLTDMPSNSAVRAMLAKLEAKGHVRHREEGLRYVYAPTTSRAAARRDALRSMVRIFFAGSARQTATALLEEESWTAAELDALSAEIDRVRKDRKRT
jgi:predicted transcriptional regulator